MTIVSIGMVSKQGYADTPVEMLEVGYSNNSDVQLSEFFEQWRFESNAIPSAELEAKPTWERNAYEIFEDFYNPINLSSIGHSEWGDAIYQGYPYLVVQNKLVVLFQNPTDATKIQMHPEYRIEDFRPRLHRLGVKILYLTSDYEDVLFKFLGNESLPLGTGGIMNPAQAKGESKSRQDFLGQSIRLFHGHWGGWHLLSHPVVSAIVFDPGMSNATVYFRLVYQGGQAQYGKQDGRWVLQKSGLTWVE